MVERGPRAEKHEIFLSFKGAFSVVVVPVVSGVSLVWEEESAAATLAA
jgi:hypothetical protein